MKFFKWLAIGLAAVWIIGLLSQSMIAKRPVHSDSVEHGATGTNGSAANTEADRLAGEVAGKTGVLGSIYTPKPANLRSAPSSSAKIVGKTFAGMRLQFIDAAPGWFRVLDPDTSKQVWVSESVIITEDEHRRRELADLSVDDWSWHEEYGYAIAEGQVTNVSSASLSHVLAVVTFSTSEGGFITSDDALIDFDPLLPGQSSPWKVSARWNPAMRNATVRFRTMRGVELSAYRR